MAKQRGDVELIEVIAPDDAADWLDAERQAVPFEALASGTPSRRSLVVGALVAAAAVAAAAVALDDDSSESTAATTAPAPSTTARALLDPTSATHFLLHDPALTPYSADIVTPPPGGQQVQVWTDGTAIGPIAILELHLHGFEPYGVVAATRDVVDGIEVVRPTANPDTVISEVAIDDNLSVTVTAVRLSDADVIKVVNGLSIVDGELADDVAVMTDLRLGRTFEAESLADLIFGRVESQVRYLAKSGEIVTLYSATGSSQNRLAGLRYLTTDAQPLVYGLTHGRLPNGDVVVVWEQDGRLLSLVSPGDLDEAIAFSGSARAATTSEWEAMVYGLRPDYRLGDFATLATGTASNGEAWRAGPQLTERNGRYEFLWWWTVPGRDNVTASAAASLAVGTRPYVETLVVPGATFVFVSQPAEGGTVSVRTASGTLFGAELAQPFPESSVRMAVVRIEEPGRVWVEINGIGVAPI